MELFLAKDYDVLPGRDVSQALDMLLQKLRGTDGEKKLCFEPGVYYISSRLCTRHMLYITNTVGDDEFSADETPHENAVPFYLKHIKNLTIEGSGAQFLIDGKVTNMALEECENIIIKNLEFRHAHPDMHELRVIRKTAFSVDFKIDRDSRYCMEDGKLFFYGTDYRQEAGQHALNAHWIGLIRAAAPERVKRVAHPLLGALRVSETGAHMIRVRFLNTVRFHKGDRFYLFDVRRQFAGIFLSRCREITLCDIKQRFNYSLALAAQDSENINLEHVEFAPGPDAPRCLASVADFMQVCMCRGRFQAAGCLFDGAGDDCLNVHGIHFKIIKKQNNQITVRFMHRQTHGFNPLRVGDRIAFIDTATLLEKGNATIQSTALLNEYEIQLLLDDARGAQVGDVIEDVSACPDVLFFGNTLKRIITRGLLITTRGRVEIKNNRFISTSMSGILLSDDAKNWYESGMCRDVTVADNIFTFCGRTPVLIKPENLKHAGAVHRNIRITGNTFEKYSGFCIRAKSTDQLLVQNNRFTTSKKLKTKNCSNVHME